MDRGNRNFDIGFAMGLGITYEMVGYITRIGHCISPFQIMKLPTRIELAVSGDKITV